LVHRLILAILAVLLLAAPAAAESPAARDFRTAQSLAAAQKYRQAIALYEKALPSPPENTTRGEIHRRIGDLYFNLNEYGRALESYRKAIRDPALADPAQTQYWIGFCFFLVGRDAEAVAELEKVPALYPEAAAWGVTAYYWAGRASERMGRKADAAEFYRKAGGSGRTTQGKFARKKAEKLKQ
jgi:tetratricopeptide (TPR) repeat protein